MPLIPNSKYKPFHFFKSGHFNTIYAATYKKHPTPIYKRKRIQTPDNDFFDVDWLQNSNNKYCVLLLHGLFGNSTSSYIRNTADYFFKNGYDVCAMNYRGESGEPNNKPHAYHAGFTDDVEQLINEIKQLDKYQYIIPIGFSLGGSILLNYLCKVHQPNDAFIKCAAAISAPLYLTEGAYLLNEKNNWLYWYYFKQKINRTAHLKKEQFLNAGIDFYALLAADNFFKVDTLYTAKVFGFESALDYYEKASVLPHLTNLKTPTLLLNALDDMMLGHNSYPAVLADQHEHLFFEMSKFGGHLGFNQKGKQYYTERVKWFVQFYNQ